MKRQRPQGFTLIEVVIILTIIIIIASLTTIDFRASNSRTAAKFDSEMFISDIRATVNRARAGERFQGQMPTGWGIIFNTAKNAYTIFADLDGDYEYDTNEKYSEEVLQLKSISATHDGDFFANMLFETGTGRVYFGEELLTPESEDIVVTLKDYDLQTVRTFTINWLGAVNTQ